MFYKLSVIIFFLLSVCYFSCSDKTEIPDERLMGYDYFPLQTGKFRIYTSDSIIYTGGGTRRDTFNSFIREVVGDSFTDTEGKSGYRIDRYFKRNMNDGWSRINTWTAYSEKTRCITNEDNLTFVKLIFPVVKSKTWNGNIFVDTDIRIDVSGEPIQMYRNWNYKIEEEGIKKNILDSEAETAVVRLVDTESVIDRRRVYETYAKGIGLVEKEMIILDGDGTGIGLQWEQKAKKGFTHKLTLIENN